MMMKAYMLKEYPGQDLSELENFMIEFDSAKDPSDARADPQNLSVEIMNIDSK